MKTCLHRKVEEQSCEVISSPAFGWGVCTSPELGGLLPEYIAELLADSVEEEIEEHLLDCLNCREKYLKVVSIGEAVRRAKAMRADESATAPQDDLTPDGAKVTKISDFRKRQPSG